MRKRKKKKKKEETRSMDKKKNWDGNNLIKFIKEKVNFKWECKKR